MGILDMMQNIKSGSFGLPPKVFMAGYYIFWIVVFLAIFFFVARYILNMSRYKFNVTLFVKRGEKDFIIIKDKAGIIKQEGREVFRLFRKREVIPRPKYEDIILDDKGKSNIYYYKAGDTDYIPINIREGTDDLEFDVVDQDDKNWAINEMGVIIDKYKPKGFWAENKEFLALVGVSMIVLLIMWMLFGKAELIANALNTASDKMSKAILEYGRMVIPPA